MGGDRQRGWIPGEARRAIVWSVDLGPGAEDRAELWQDSGLVCADQISFPKGSLRSSIPSQWLERMGLL